MSKIKLTDKEKIQSSEKIRKLLKKRNAIMLAHNYQPPEIQDVADLCGDSLKLSIRASATSAEIIVFAGVHFMAETASILSPDKTVLLPCANAGCQMADMITPEALAARKKQFPGVPVVTYVNSPAAVKALSDVCCTSANAVGVVNSIDADEVLMAPDRNLARYTAARTQKKIHYWDGCCPFHDCLIPEDIKKVRKMYPGATLMAHPECRPEVLDLADFIFSTSGMLAYPETTDQDTFIIGTETGIIHPMKKRYPDRTFIPASKKLFCEDMKRISLSDVITCLEQMSGEISVPEQIRVPALAAVKKMTQILS